jgi:PAS domain S-box-containing protein
MSRFFSSLRSRLVILVVVAVVPALAQMIFSSIERKREAARNVQRDAQRLARLASASQERLTEGARQLLLALSRLPEVRRADTEACNKLFAELLRQFASYANIGGIRLNGDVFASGLPLSGAVNLADRAYFQRAIATKSFAVGDFQIGRITKKPSINFGYPIFDESGQINGVVFVALDLDWLNQFAAQAQLPSGSVLTVFDRAGIVLARYPDPQQWVGKPLTEEPLVRQIRALLTIQPEGATESVGADNVQRLIAFTRLAGSPRGQEVYVCIGVPSRVAYAEANRVLRRDLVALAAVTLIALVAAWTGSSLFVLRRIRPILEATRKIASGDLSARTGMPRGATELQQLAQSFDQMAESLQQKEAERQRARDELQRERDLLESRVRERTADLSAAIAQLRNEIAERKRAESALRQSQDRYQRLVDTARDIIFELSADGQFVALNPAFETITGLPRDDWLGKPFTSLVAPEDQSRAAELLRRNLSGGSFPAFELTLCGKQRKRIVAEITTTPQLLEGQVLGVFGFARDVSARKEAEAALRESEERFRATFEQAAVGIAQVAPDGRWLRVNGKLCQIVGYRREELTQKTFQDITEAADLATELQYVRQMLAGEIQSYSMEKRYLRKDGEAVWVNLTAALVREASGEPKYFVSVVEDISERKKLEEALRLRNEQMESDLRMARDVQRAFLPHQFPAFPSHAKPQENALVFAHRYLPAREVGGDFFTVLPLADTLAGVFICDVMGHGMRAALVTALVRGLVEELSRIAREPGRFLTEIDRGLQAILKQTKDPMFASAFYAVLDLQEGEARFASAGHPSPLLLQRDMRTVEPLSPPESVGPALGLFEDNVYVSSGRSLCEGDALLFFTDGLYEVANADGEEFGKRRLIETVQERVLLPTERLLDELLEEARRHSNRVGFDDDVCVVGVDIARVGNIA